MSMSWFIKTREGSCNLLLFNNVVPIFQSLELLVSFPGVCFTDCTVALLMSNETKYSHPFLLRVVFQNKSCFN